MLQMKKLTVDGVTYAVTDETKLPLPETAAVGQFLKVTEVDETGQVTKLETAEVSGLSKTLIWENASPLSAFAAQTITLDLDGYDEIEIEFQEYGKNLNVGMMVLSRCALSNVEGASGTGLCVDASSMRILCNRVFLLLTTGIQFISALYNGGTLNDLYLIPYKIYGIKGVITQ